LGKGGFAVSFYVLLLKRNKLRQPKCQLIAGFASCCVSRACSWCNGNPHINHSHNSKCVYSAEIALFYAETLVFKKEWEWG
jgi:hypothetical protein